MERNIMQAPYGSWESPISAELIASGGIKLSSAFEHEGSVYYSEMRPNEKGRNALMRIEEDLHVELLPPEHNIRTTVHEYGGGSFLMVRDTLYFSNFSTQQIYARLEDGTIRQITNEPDTRFADGCYDLARDLIYYVLEIHGKTVDNLIATVDPKSGTVRVIAQGCDFYSNPRVSPDHKTLSYYCWNHPNMPWDGGQLHIAKINLDGSLEAHRVVAGGEHESICQPTWGPDGKLYFISDRTGWWNLYRDNEGAIESLCRMEAEFGQPQWVFGTTTFAFWGEDKIVCVIAENGIDSLAFIPLKGGECQKVKTPYTSIKNPFICDNKLYFIGGSAVQPAAAIYYDLTTRTVQVLKESRQVPVDPSFFSVPHRIEFPTENEGIAHAFYYAPKNPNFLKVEGELPPLLVLSHGGPTSQSSQLFSLEIQYWTSRGIAVLDVNYGGSSGYGRAYRDKLLGRWGIVDVDDCTNGALYCVRQGLADQNRLAIAGGSAGGYTTLAALTFRDIFKAGASFYGVCDLEALAKHTHKFEARYLDKLIGPYPAAKNLYLERSPIHHVEQIQCPIILLQGGEDVIVPPSQSEMMYQSLVKRGIPTAYLLFAQEQHGFRQAANIKRAIEAQSYFFSQIFGYELADKIEAIEIKNFPAAKRVFDPHLR